MLTETELAVLGVERRLWVREGAKIGAIGLETGLSPTRYYQVLSALLDRSDALEHDPVTINRLRRLRESRRACSQVGDSL
jgi:hypothetical protein